MSDLVSGTAGATRLAVPVVMRATSLREVPLVAKVEPLPIGDSRYAVLRDGSRQREIAKIVAQLRDAASVGQASDQKIVLVGHKGTGKTTELFRIERDLSDLYFPVHAAMDEGMEGHCDYSLLLLKLCEQVCVSFAAAGIPLDRRIVDDIGEWFLAGAETTTKLSETAYKAEVAAEGKIGGKLPWLGVWLMSKLLVATRGSEEVRQVFTQNITRKSDELVSKVNLLLAEAENVLAKAGKPQRLLVVNDNYDRLEREPAHRLFIESGDILRAIKVASIFTAPVTARLEPFNVALKFESCYSLHTVKLWNRDGSRNSGGVAAMHDLLAARLDMDAIFAKDGAIDRLIEKSGGSARELIRLLLKSQVNANVDLKDRIDLASVEEAVKDFGGQFRRSFLQERLYYPRLAMIHLTKKAAVASSDVVDPERMEHERQFFEGLLAIGAVMEYNGDDYWYDVHPIILDIPAFNEAVIKAQAALAARADG